MTSSHISEHIVGFVHLLRSMDIKVGAGQTVDFCRAMAEVPITDRDALHDAALCTLITKPEEIPLFETAFAFYFRPLSDFDPAQLAIPVVRVPQRPLRIPRRKPKPQQEGADQPEEEQTEEQKVGLTLAYSSSETLRTRDFGSFSYEEVQQARDMMRRMRWRPALRRTRRKRASKRRGSIDLRQIMRSSMRFAGEPLRMAYRRPRFRRRPLVVLCDISGSMDRYSRMLLHFVHTLSDGIGQVETFVFGTRLTRITRLLRSKDVDDAVALVSNQVLDWSGGTRIGNTIREFNVRWSRRVMSHGPVVLIISDGWDRGDPTLLSREMARLQRSCHRLIWLNPLLGNPRYQPLTQGMQAALPYIDDFLAVHNLQSVEQLGQVLATLGQTRRARQQRKTNTSTTNQA
jgi:uncharacterized protein with von Willebrand factor type A (vWA) domain